MGLKLEEVVGKVLTEKQFDEAAGEKDACYNKVKARYDVWPSAYASGALVKCRKVGAKNWGNKSKKEGVNEGNPLELGKLKDAIKMFQKRIKKQGRVTNARDEEHLKRLMKVYNDMGGRKIKENNELFEWLQEACWKGYEKKGMKTMFGKRYPNCVKKKKSESVNEVSDKQKRKIYKKAFGKEYDDPKRKQAPLPLDIAYKVALNRLKKKEGVNENSAEKEKIFKYLVKKGDTPTDARYELNRSYDFVKKRYKTASVAKKAQIISDLSKYESVNEAVEMGKGVKK